MKILYVNSNLKISSGITRHIVMLANQLCTQHSIHVIAGSSEASKMLNNERIHFKKIETLQYERRNMIYFLLSIIRIYFYVSLNKIELIHAQDHYTSSIAKAVSFIAKTKFIQTIHSNYTRKGLLPLWTGQHCIFVNNFLFTEAASRFQLLRGNSSLIYNGIDSENMVTPIRGDSPIYLLMVSRLTKKKGVMTALEAFNYISINCPNIAERIYMRIIGDGEEKKSLQQYVSANKLKVDFIGEIEDVEPYYRDSHIFVCTSLNEGFGYVLLEAGKYGCFVISSDFTGVDSILRNNIDGLIYAKNSSQDLAQKIMYAVTLDEDRAIYVSKFQQRIKIMFDLKTMLQKTISVYNIY